jgi:hypothetical protein
MHWEMFMDKKSAVTTAYICPMHSDVRQSPSGKCPRCGMALVPEKHALCLAAAHVRKPFAHRYYGCGDGGNHGGSNDDALITRFVAKIKRQGLPEHDHEKNNQHAVPHARARARGDMSRLL